MRVRSAVLLLIIASCSTPLWASAEVNKFVLLQNSNKQVGTASYSIEEMRDGGYKIHSMYEYKLAASSQTAAGAATSQSSGGGRRGGGQAPGVPVFGQFLFEYKVTQTGEFLSGFTEDMSNQKMTSYQPGKQRERLSISQAQGGHIGLTEPVLLPKSDYLVTPAFDVSAIQVLLTKALEHPSEDKTYLVIIQGPGGTGNTPAYIILLPAGTARGTFEGKPVNLRRYRLNYNNSHADVFADEGGKLMEADMDMFTTDIVRSGFVLAE